MSVGKVPLGQEGLARHNVDFYGFWLWHYMMPDVGTDAEIAAKLQSLQRMERSCDCRDKNTKCPSCPALADFLQASKIFTVYKPWTDYVNAEDTMRVLKHSADEILSEAVNVFDNNVPLNLDKRFVLNRCGFCFKDVTVKGSKQKFGIQKMYTSRVTVEHILPSFMGASDYERLDMYTKYLDENKCKHSQDRLRYFLISIGSAGMDYVAIDKFIKTLSMTPMTKKDFLNRAIGYWLYSKSSKTVSGILSKYIVDALHCKLEVVANDSPVVRKIEQRRHSYFKNMFDMTKSSVNSKNIFHFGATEKLQN